VPVGDRELPLCLAVQLRGAFINPSRSFDLTKADLHAKVCLL
jgi:hypothetical protein